MKLVEFQILNFRSINDSGPIKASKLTTLVGRNESGKSNLLLGLGSLNPPEGIAPLSPIKDYPRDRRLSECTDETRVVESRWELDATEQSKLGAIFPRAAGVSEVTVARDYKGKRYFGFVDLPSNHLSTSEVSARVKKIKPVVASRAEKAGEVEGTDRLVAALSSFEEAASASGIPSQWAESISPKMVELRQALAGLDVDLTPTAEAALTELEALAEELPVDATAHIEARTWVREQLPIFIYLDEYPDMPGHQNIEEYLDRKAHSRTTVADDNFEKLCKVADLDPKQLQRLQGTKDAETRNQLVNRASALVTGDIRRLWKDRELKVRLNLDAEHLDTLISDPNAVYDVEVNLDERSRGFKWFFSFFVTFAADTKGGPSENAVVLLDEPGLYLHAASQGDLLKYLASDMANQVIFTTHSPFMIPTDNLDAVRTVNIAAQAGTTVTNDPTGDSRTLFPLQAALGYKLSQSLFVGPANIVVEGVTDFWFISAASEYLRDKRRTGLTPELTLTPAGGAQKVSYMVALLSSENLGVLVLLDDEKRARATSNELIKSKLIHPDSVLFATEGFASSPPSEGDIEDLISPSVYAALVNEAYKAELSGKSLALNANIPRIVKRYEDAFEKAGLPFNKTRPARLFLKKMATTPDALMASGTDDRFELLFQTVNDRFEKLKGKGFKL